MDQRSTRDRPGRPAARSVASSALAGLVVVLGLAGCESTGWFKPPSSSASAAAEGPVVTDLRGFRIDVRRGQTFEVRLPSNASTGYRWTLVDPVPPVVRGVGVGRYEQGRTDLAGAPGIETWTFEAVSAGSGPLNFEYRRPWEPPTVPPAQRAAYRVEVR
jgi:inhibitor of cysteine peptidase